MTAVETSIDHSPGPWRAERETPVRPYRVVAANGVVVADNISNAANAKLIEWAVNYLTRVLWPRDQAQIDQLGKCRGCSREIEWVGNHWRPTEQSEGTATCLMFGCIPLTVEGVVVEPPEPEPAESRIRTGDKGWVYMPENG